MSTKRDYYEVLSVERSADGETIKKAYRKLAFQYHPDRNQEDPKAAERFKEAAEAYQVLCDPEKRGLYDRFGHDAARQSGFSPGFSDVDDVFSAFGDIFGDFFGFGGRRHASRGSDLEIELELTLEEAVRGVKKSVRVARRVPCAACNGTGASGGARDSCSTCRGRGQVAHSRGFFVISTTCPTCRGTGHIVRDPCRECRGRGLVEKNESLDVTIPPGVDNGQTLRIAGRGQPSVDGGTAGHLYVVLRVLEDDRFERHGNDLVTHATIPMTLAALGGEIRVATLDGERAVQIDPGTQPEHQVLLRGLGVPRLDSPGKGDQIVLIHVAIPKKLNSRQKELLRDLSRESSETISPRKSGFFRRRR